MQIITLKKVDKYLSKQYKGDPNGIHLVRLFLDKKLATADNPLSLPNCKKLVGYEKLWRWRVGSYRIIAEVTSNNELIIKIIEIDKKDGNTYKGL